MMTKQNFEALAVALGEAVDLEDAVQRITNVCAAASPNFDPDRFRARIDEVVVEAAERDMEALRA